MNDSDFNVLNSIEETLQFRSLLSEGYHDFLKKYDPITRWDEIVPLAFPVSIEKKYEINREFIEEYAALCPSLVSMANSFGENLAPLLGLRYAWSRIGIHCQILDGLSTVVEEIGEPRVIIEPGSFCSGLIHFLPTVYDVNYIGIDISPTALDVCRKIEQDLELPGQRYLLKADCLAVGVPTLKQTIGPEKIQIEDTIVIICNLLTNIEQTWDKIPAIDGRQISAGLVSYWVNEGATVLICERTDVPADYLKQIVDFGTWTKPASAKMLNEFTSFSTREMSRENPIGDWYESRGCLAMIRQD